MRTIKQEQYFPMLMLFLVLIWLVNLVIYSGDYPYSTRQLVGEMVASWVVIVLSINFLMATRAKYVEKLLGGLDKMYMIHRRAGYFAVGFLLLHYLVIPHTHEFAIGKPMGFFALLFILLGVVLASAPLFKRKLPYHKWVNMHKLMGLFYILGVVHSFFVPTLISQLPIVRMFVYTFALIGILAWIYRIALYDRYHQKLSYMVAEVKNFPNDVTEVFLEPKTKQLLYTPGQFTFLSIEGENGGEAHPYTISSHPSDDRLRFSIKALGDYTANLQSSLKNGVKTTVQGRFGAFSFTDSSRKKQVWFAGGIGITPFLSFLKEVDGSHDIKLVWSVGTVEEANYKEEVEQIAAEKGNIQFVLWDTATKGYFTIDQQFTSSSLRDHSVFICGPEKMRESYIDQLLEKGVAMEDIHYEEFGFR